MDAFIKQRIYGLSSLIGNTPLLAVKFTYKGQKRTIYAKAENLNMTGSIKDRMAFHILNKGYERGLLKRGYTIIEATSGNTGVAIAAIGRALGHPVTIFMPDWMSEERINLIKSLGSKIYLISKEEGGFLGSIDRAEKLAIEKNPKLEIHPLEPANSPTLTTGYKIGKHRIQGISDEFIPSILKLDQLDSVVCVDDGDAIIMAQKLASVLVLEYHRELIFLVL